MLFSSERSRLTIKTLGFHAYGVKKHLCYPILNKYFNVSIDLKTTKLL